MQRKTVVSLLSSASTLLLAGSLQAGEVKWADPLPNTAGVKAADATPATPATPAVDAIPATATSPAVPAVPAKPAADAKPAVVGVPATGGIGYEWTVTLGNNDSADFTGSVGAKSSYEPTFKAPEFAWTHTTDFVALNLTADAKVSIMVTRQQGVTDASVDKTTNALVLKEAGNLLNPVVAVWKNWEESGVETGSFNPLGKTSWMNELAYVGIAYADKGQSMIIYTVDLPKGKYTLNIGGANAYEPNGCAATNAACYTGTHGYRVEITTGTGAVDHMH
ncbi:MAG: hypothetical protein HOP02_14145 [Methylococcaceae bacterium]|nr:hypothetical protein [Methylococcaceae bacterium]